MIDGTMQMPQLAARPAPTVQISDRAGPDTIPLDREVRSERHFALDEAARIAGLHARPLRPQVSPRTARRRRLDAVNAGIWGWCVAVATVGAVIALLVGVMR